MKKILLALLALLIVPAVYAAVDVTYVFNQNNVEVSMYNCNDSTCSQVTPFSGSIIDGPSVTDGTITIRYPDALATPFGYAGFFVSKGYRPLELHSTRHTGGQSGLAPPITVNAEFTKYPVVCRAVVSELNFVNELQPNIPLVVNTTAKLDAQTSSAFQLTDNDVGYVPAEFKQEYYGADTIVKMEVLQNSNVIHSQQQEFSAVKGNSLIADSTVPVQFTYLPSATGDFTVKVTAQVVDDQCASTEDQNAQGAFSVLAAAPQGQFYTILNGLTVNNTHPRVGQPVLVSYNKITNHADGSGVLTPIQTNVTYSVKNGATNVFSHITTLYVNPDALTPVTYSFVFTPTAAGVHTITVNGFSNSILPVSQLEIKDTETMQLNVIGSMSYKVVFSVNNGASGLPIENATVSLSGIGSNLTNAQGVIVFPIVPEGMYTYTVSAANFSTKRGDLRVTSDVTKAVVLHPGENESVANTAPYMNLPDNFQLQVNGARSFNFFPYVQDDQDRDSELKLTVISGDTDITVDINPDGQVTFIPDTGFTGSNTIRFQLSDTQNATATDSIVVSVVAGGAAAPVFSTIPEIETNEDTAAVRALNLRDYVSDADTADDKLVFSVLSVTPSTLATARIDDGQFLTILPKPNENGLGSVVIVVTDGTNFVNETVDFDVFPVNDAPVVISVPKIPAINESTSYTLNLSLVFFDVDNDPLIYNVTQPANVTLIPNASVPSVTIVPDFNVNGIRTFNITAIDPDGLSAKATFTLFLNFVDDKPFFNMIVPNINTYEEVPNNHDLTPYENDPEDGPDANGNSLTWKMQIANQSNLSPVTSLSTSLFDAVINTITDMLIVTPKANQSGTMDITLYLFDSTGKNVSQNITINITNINDAPAFVNLGNKVAEAGQIFVFDVNATDSDPTNDTITFGLINVTPPLTGLSIDNATGMINFTPMTNGVFTVNLQTCDFANCSNGSFVLTVTDSTAPVPDGQVIPPNPSIYAPGANYTFSINWTDNGNITNVTFELGGVTYTNVSQSGTEYTTTVTDLAAGNYTFKWIAKDGANNMNMSNSSNFIVLKAQSDLQLLLNGTAGNITVPQGTVVNTTANLTNATGTVSIFRNGTLVTSGASPLSANITFPTQGSFNITATFAGNQNYTGSNTTWFVTVPDTVAPIFTTITSATPGTPAMFTSLYTFSIAVTDNVGVAAVTLLVDNSTIAPATQIGNSSSYQVNLTSLSVGNHSMTWFAIDAADNVNTTSFNYTVTPGIAALTLTINGVAGNTTAQVNDTVSFVANVTNPAGGPVDLYVNGTLATSSPTTPLTFNTSFASFGTVPITAVFTGDANVSAGNITRFLTITPIVMQANITPASGSLLNYSSFIMTLNTNGVTSCKWSFLDEAQGSMTNSFTTSNGLSHSANVSGLGLGVNPVFVACNNQSAATNSDLVYTAVNILDGSVLIGSNSISDTIMRSSTLSGNTITNTTGTTNTLTNVTASANSVINNSVLTNCIITNAIVLSITASDCVLADGIYDPSNLTGSNIGGSSSVTNSTVTFSNVTNSTILNANINNTTLNGCSVTNSRLGTTTIDCVNTTVPLNDNFANGLTIPSVPYAQIISTALATTEAGEPSPCGGTQNTVWYYFTPTVSGNYDFNTFGSDYDTVLAVYTGATLVSLTDVDCNDDTVFLQSQLVLPLTAGTTYRIQVGGFFGDTGLLTINLLTEGGVPASASAQGGSLANSNVTFSNVTNSIIVDSNINNSVVSSCIIINSSFSNAAVSNCVITNMVISSGSISVSTPNGTFTYDANVSGPANLSAVIPVPPVANFVPLSGTTTPGTNITFTSTSTDANIPGPLNDSLTFFWNFGDGSNATSANVSKAYSAIGTYTITLTATDAFGFTSTKVGSRTIANPVVPSSGGGGGGSRGGGGGGGGGSGTARIALSDVPVVRVVYQGQALQFTIDGKLQPLSATLRRVDFAKSNTEWVVNGVFYNVGKNGSRQFDLTRDNKPELDLTIVEVTRNSATISAKLAGAAKVATPPLPSFNFTPVKQPEVQGQPEAPVVDVQPEVETVPVTADVEQSKMQKFTQKLKDLFIFKLSAKSAAVKAGIVIAVIVIGLIAYALFVRWESF